MTYNLSMFWNLGEEEASACHTGPCWRGGRAWRLSNLLKEEEQEEDEAPDHLALATPPFSQNSATAVARTSFKNRLSKHMLVVHRTGSVGVVGMYVREIILSLDGISVGGQSTREREGSPL